MSGSHVTWQKGRELILYRLNGEEKKVGEGTSLKVVEFADTTVLALWESDDQIMFKKL